MYSCVEWQEFYRSLETCEHKSILTAKLVMSEMIIPQFPFWGFWCMLSKMILWMSSGKHEELHTILMQLKNVFFLVNKTIDIVQHWDKELCNQIRMLNCQLHCRKFYLVALIQALCNRLQFKMAVLDESNHFW